MGDHPIETAPQDGTRITVLRGAEEHRGAYWFEGDLTAGWANRFGKPLHFEPTHWHDRAARSNSN